MDHKRESGLRLRQARDAKGLKLEELARLTDGLTKSRISNYEQGLRYMDPAAAKQLARALGVSAAYLMCVDDQAALSSDEAKLLEKYRSLDRRGRETLQIVADTQASYRSRKVEATRP